VFFIKSEFSIKVLHAKFKCDDKKIQLTILIDKYGKYSLRLRLNKMLYKGPIPKTITPVPIVTQNGPSNERRYLCFKYIKEKKNAKLNIFIISILQ
jgi:hypothetical protein